MRVKNYPKRIAPVVLAALVTAVAAPATARDAEEDEMPASESDAEPAESEADRDKGADQDVDAPDRDADESRDEKGDKKWGGRVRDHYKQGFFNILVGTGYFLVAPYDQDALDKRCANSTEHPGEGEALCTGRVGWHLDMLAGYGLKPGFELFLMLRIGVERPDADGLINQPKTRQIGIGVKVYTPKAGFFKMGFGVAPLLDFSDRGPLAGVRNDLVFHVPIQALFDIFPWFGAYAQVAPNLSFIQEFRVEFTGGIGLQGRFP